MLLLCFVYNLCIYYVYINVCLNVYSIKIPYYTLQNKWNNIKYQVSGMWGILKQYKKKTLFTCFLLF